MRKDTMFSRSEAITHDSSTEYNKDFPTSLISIQNVRLTNIGNCMRPKPVRVVPFRKTLTASCAWCMATVDYREIGLYIPTDLFLKKHHI